MSLFSNIENDNSKITIPENKQIFDKYMSLSIDNIDIIIFLVNINDIDTYLFDVSLPLSKKYDNDVIIMVLYIQENEDTSELFKLTDNILSYDNLYCAIKYTKHYLMIEITLTSTIAINEYLSIQNNNILFWIEYSGDTILHGINGVFINNKIILPENIKISYTVDDPYKFIESQFVNSYQEVYDSLRINIEQHIDESKPYDNHPFLVDFTSYGSKLSEHPIFESIIDNKLPQWIIFEMLWKCT